MRILTRKSPLALWQAEFVAKQLLHHHPDLPIEIVPLVTQGDQILDRPLYKIGGKALFVKELEQGLLAQTGDIAVHSLKDVPHEFPEGLGLSTILPREDPRDAWVCPRGILLQDLPAGATVGTSSLRRLVQLKALRPDLHFEPLRGNVGTRLQKCFDGQFDAIVLAYAGLKRLQLEHHVTHIFSIDDCLPATGQGALGIECRLDDQPTVQAIQCLRDQNTTTRVLAERALSAGLNSSCQTPVACFAIIDNDALTLKVRLGCPKTLKIINVTLRGPAAEPVALGQAAAKEIYAKGGEEILAQCRQ